MMLIGKTHWRKAGLSVIAVMAAVVPVSAALWSPPPPLNGPDMARYDAVTRVGSAQLPTDPFCDRPDIVANSLTDDYDETVQISARNDEGARFDFWASDAGGTWTVVYTRDDGIACVIGSGMGWRAGAAAGQFLQEVGITL